jgi:hypothetical protein
MPFSINYELRITNHELRIMHYALLSKSTFCAFGISRRADVTAVQKQPMVCEVLDIVGKAFFQLRLGLERRLGIDSKPNARRNPEYMRIYGNHLCAKKHGCHDIRGLGSNTRKLLEAFNICGDIAIEIVHYHPCHREEVAAFGIGIGNRFYVRQ